MVTPLELQIIAARQDRKILYLSLGCSEDEAKAYAADFAEGIRQCSESVALIMLQEHETLPRIMKYSGLTREQIEKIAQTHNLTLNEG